MEIFKDKKVIALVVIMSVFTLAYFIIANKISYAFQTDNNFEESYKISLQIIEKSSMAYIKKNPKMFEKDKRVYIKVQDLIDNNLLFPNEDGNVINPTNGEKMNDLVIELKADGDKITATIEK